MVQVIVTVDEVTVPVVTADITGGTTELATVTEMLAVAVLPAVSLAITATVWGPLAAVVVSQE